MRVLYMSHRYHTDQNTIMKGWKENGHEICFISQYEGKIEDYTWVKPVVMGYGALFRLIDKFYVNVLFRKRPFAMDMRLKCGWPPILKMAKKIREFQPDVAILRERSISLTICATSGSCSVGPIGPQMPAGLEGVACFQALMYSSASAQ